MKRPTTALLVLLAVAIATSVALPATVLASHEPESTDYTVDTSTPSPGASGVTYTHDVALTDNFGDQRSGFETVSSASFSMPAGNVSGCSGGLVTSDYTLTVTEPDGQEEFEEVEASFSGGTASFDITDDQRDYAVGETLRLVLEDCVGNPSEAGWYQVDVTVQGTAFGDGDSIELSSQSHYFPVCEDCDNDSAARAELGPPPSDPTPTPTPEPTPTPDPTATPTPEPTPEPPSVDDPTATPTSPPNTPTPTASPTAESQNGTPTATATSTTGSGADQQFFGVDPMIVVAVVAAVSIGLAAFGATRL